MLKPRNGFTLVEVLITVTVMVITLVGIMRIFLYCRDLGYATSSVTKAMTEAKDKMEEIRNYDFGSILSYHKTSFPLTKLPDGRGVIYVSEAGGSPGFEGRLLEVKITVSWQEGGRVFGDDADLDGEIDTGEDPDVNDELDSMAAIVTRIAERY